MRYYILVALLAANTGCDARKPANNTHSEQTGVGASAPTYKPGQNLIVLKEGAKCVDVSDEPDAEPWEMAKGAVVGFVRTDGAELIVETGPDMPCRIAADAVGPV